MKHLFSFSLCMVAALGLTAQQDWVQRDEPSPSNLHPQAMILGAGQDGRTEVIQSRGGSVVFSEDFSEGFAGSNGNGAWTVEDNGDNSIWLYVAPGNQGQYADGSPTGSSHPGGQFSFDNSNPANPQYSPLESTTAGNGWMVFDADFYNTVNNVVPDAYVYTEGSLVSPIIDLSLYPSVTVNWESFFRYCCAQDAPLFLDVGVIEEGVTTWTAFDGYGDVIPSANTASDNALSVSIDVSCAAALMDSVRIRFGYRSPEGGSQNYSTYFWGIDDVTITTVEPNTDLRVTQVANGDVYNDFEYRMTPMEQAISESDGGLIAGVMVQNMGTTSVEDIAVLVEILNEGGDVLESATDTIDVIFALSDAPLCPASSVRDTVYFETGWTPAETGTYTLRATLITDSLDATPEDNVLSKEFLYTEDEYAHDNAPASTWEGWNSLQENGDFYEPGGFGNYYHCPNEGSSAYGLAVHFGSRCSWDINDTPSELEFETRLYEYDRGAGVPLDNSPYESEYWVFEEFGSLADEEIYLPFESPVSMAAEGFLHFAAVLSEFASPGRISVRFEPDSDTDYGSLRYRDGWRWAGGLTPHVRVITSEREAIVMMDELLAKQGVVLEQNVPNPAKGNTVIRFGLAQHHEVALEVRDMTGRIVASKDMGTLGAGEHTWELNVGGWSSGMYTYTLKADRWSTTKKMLVD